MDLISTYRILDLKEDATINDVEKARRKLLHALHPDKNKPANMEIFQKLTREIIEASEFLSNHLSRKKAGKSIEEILFNDFSYSKEISSSEDIIVFDRRYAADKVLAVAVIEINNSFNWNTTDINGNRNDHNGCSLSILLMNRTDKPIKDLSIGDNSYLVDNLGFQYSPCDTSFYWLGEKGNFNTHADFIVPNSKVEGFILFPSLRKNANYFTRWFLNGKFWIDEDLHKGSYNINLS